MHNSVEDVAVPAIELTPSDSPEQAPCAAPQCDATVPLPFDPDPEIALDLTRSDRRFLLASGGIVLALATVHWARLSGFGLQEIEIDRLPERQYEFRIDINQATWVEWMQLDNIGELTARKIIADRETRGPFRSVDDLQRVSGIDP